MLKPGISTTEFLLTVAAAVGMLASALAGDLSPHWAAIATAVATGAYAVSRGLAKTGAVTTVVPAAPPTPIKGA